jgi:hypothetical protein
MNECKGKQHNLQLFTSCILLLSAASRSALTDIDVFLNLGSYDFHRMRKLNTLRRRLAAYASIADHYRAATARGDPTP